MAIKFTDKEIEFIKRTKQEAADLDVDNLLRHAVFVMTKLDARGMADLVIAVFDAITNIVKISTADMVRDGATREGTEIDDLIDMLGRILTVADFSTAMSELIKHMAEPDDKHGSVGVLTTDASIVSRLQEEARIAMVRARGEHQRKRARRT